MVELDLNAVNELRSVWLKGVDASDYLQTARSLLAILGRQRQPRMETFMAAFAVLYQLSSYTESLFPSDVPRYIENHFFTCGRFPYQHTKINQWFTLSSADSELREQAVNIINVDRNGITRKCYTTQDRVRNFPESLLTSDYEIFFHGTRPESAQDIIEHGIDLSKGARRKDFSNGDGFYLGKNFDEAWSTTWASNRPPCSAVLVFQVRKSELRAKRNSLDLQGDNEQWREVVREFRSGKPDQKFRKNFRQYEFIEGPMSPISSESQNFKHPTPIGGSYQLCVRNVSCAELFDQSLHSVIFFER